MASPSVKTRVLIISDTHNTPLKPASSTQAFRQPLPSADVLIHCGDLTMKGGLDEYKSTLDMLAQIDAKLKIVIAGNHDLTLDEEWMGRHNFDMEECKKAHWMWRDENGRARREGVVLLEEGVGTFELESGGVLTVYASPYQPEFYDWAFPYEKNEDRYNPPESTFTDALNIADYPVPSFEDKHIDIMMTHGPPWKRLDPTASGPVGCPHLLKALTRCRPLVHCFGHIHEGWGAEVVHWAEGATEEASVRSTMQEYMNGGWDKGVEKGKGVETVEHDLAKMNEERCVFVDVTEGSGREVHRGKQTLLVNAAIMDERYHPVNAPFLVDLDLPRK